MAILSFLFLSASDQSLVELAKKTKTRLPKGFPVREEGKKVVKDGQKRNAKPAASSARVCLVLFVISDLPIPVLLAPNNVSYQPFL